MATRIQLLATLVIVVLSCRLAIATEYELLLKEVLEALVAGRVPYKFKPVKYVDGAFFCASDTPAASLPLGQIAGVGTGVSGEARCALYCQDLAGCVSFNYRTAPLTDGTQCQLFTKAPTSCSHYDQTCRHYEAIDKSASCKNTAGFTYNAQNNVYYRLIYERMSFGNAQKRCQELSSLSHPLSFKTSNEYDNFVTFVYKTLPADQLAKCNDGTKNVWWLAKRRVDYTCSKGWIWDQYNRQDAGTMPEQLWEGAKWSDGQPDCFQSGESCVQMRSDLGYKLNDVPCDYTCCLVCQIDVE